MQHVSEILPAIASQCGITVTKHTTARLEIARLSDARERLSAQRLAATAEIQALQSQLDAKLDRLLTAGSDDELAAQAGTASYDICERIHCAESACVAAERAEVELTPRLEKALAELWEAEAAAIDRQAAALEKELAVQVARENDAMQKLVEVSGGAAFVSGWSHTRQVLALQAMSGKGSTIPAEMLPEICPKSVRLAQELAAVREQAAAIRRQQVRSAGCVSGYSLAELLVETTKPGILGPSAGEVHQWFDGLAAQVRKLEEKIAAGNESRRVVFMLSWSGGRIDAAASGVAAEHVTVWRTRSAAERASTPEA